MDYFLDMDVQLAQRETAKYVLIPVPYDATSTFIKGADKGPQAIIDASDSLELYDIQYNIEACAAGIHTDKPIIDTSSPEKMVKSVYQRVKAFLAENKRIGLLGGEHSISIGAIRAVSENFPQLSVLQIDAHADLRDNYHNSPYNHACVMRQAQACANVVQVGIRNVCREEQGYIVPENIFYAHQIQDNTQWIEQVTERLTDNVYLTVDLDGLDPSILPATGTPLPGGLGWYPLLQLLERVIKTKKVVAFDVVELCPQEQHKASDVLAAALVYKIIALMELADNFSYLCTHF
ncbi:MAG: agmatinase [Bacteroidales bacterium]|jgi:agmatinase|nr:agmatinase [Bacteroidales bacterium]